MFPKIDTKDIDTVQREVQSIYGAILPNSDQAIVANAFGWIIRCFSGLHKNYQAIDVKYHDLEHTLQVVLCMMRLINGRCKADAKPQFTEKMVELGLLAMLLHDTGYLKTSTDKEGTGAKYTLTHVDRSCDFAAELLTEKGYSQKAIQSVQNMIRCTGVDVKLDSIPFHNDLERIAGFALGTSDLLGQMAADDYIEKLPFLYIEFEESFQHSKKRTPVAKSFADVNDLLRSTPLFWENYVKPRLNNDFGRLYEFLNDPYPNGPNEYIQRVEANIAKIEEKYKDNR